MTDDLVAVGMCPEHGLVTGEDAEVEFPTRAECSCGEDLEKATYADPEQVEQHA